MISDNLKISTRQFGRLVVLDWLAKAVLLLPGFAGDLSSRSFLLSLFGGVLSAFVYAWLVGKMACQVRGSFHTYVCESMGRGFARFLALLYVCYAFLNTVLLVRLFGMIAVTFVLPEASQEILMAAVLLGGVYILSGGLEVRARVGEVFYTVVLYPLVFLLVCIAFSLDPGYLSPGNAELSLRMAGHGMKAFTVFGGMGIFLYLIPHLNSRQAAGHTLKRAVVVTGAVVCSLFLASIGAFGGSGMRALAWPVVTLMSSAEIPGGFLQRWDVIFTGLLLASFFPAVSAGMFYMQTLTVEIFERKTRPRGALIALAVFAAALWCGSYGTAVRVYTIVNGYLCVPLAVMCTVILGVVEFVKRRKGT